MAGKVREYDKFCLNLKNTHNILALMALDTELNQLHRLCIEQGPFFKFLFEEVASDALRQGLKQRIPRQPANESHFERSYWKPTITDRQIETIDYTISNFLERWTQVYNRFQMDIFHPRPDDVHALSPLSIMNTEIFKLSHNIIAICRDLTTSTDAKGTWERAAAPPGQGETQTANCELSNLLAQLTQTDDIHRECEEYVVHIESILKNMNSQGHGNPAHVKPEMLRMCKLCLEAIDEYHSLSSHKYDNDNILIHRLYNTLVTLIKPFYTLNNTTPYPTDVKQMLRNIVFDLCRVGGLINSGRRLELRACMLQVPETDHAPYSDTRVTQCLSMY